MDTIKQIEMKGKITKGNLIPQPHSRNLIKGINSSAVFFVRYSGPFLKWRKKDLLQMDRKRKLIMMNMALHPRDDVDWLYASRKEGGRRLTSIVDSVDASKQWFLDYINVHGGRRIIAIRNNTKNTSINRTKITRKPKWEEIQLNGHFKRQTSKISHEKT